MEEMQQKYMQKNRFYHRYTRCSSCHPLIDFVSRIRGLEQPRRKPRLRLLRPRRLRGLLFNALTQSLPFLLKNLMEDRLARRHVLCPCDLRRGKQDVRCRAIRGDKICLRVSIWPHAEFQLWTWLRAVHGTGKVHR